MLEPDQWDAVLSRVSGTIYRSTERVSTAHCLDLLEVGPDPVLRTRVVKHHGAPDSTPHRSSFPAAGTIRLCTPPRGPVR